MKTEMMYFGLLLMCYAMLSLAEEKIINANIFELDNSSENQLRFRRDVISDNKTSDHTYYQSTYIENGANYFIDLRTPQDGLTVLKHNKSSSSYRKAYSVALDFKFMYYGNLVDYIVITTGGFISIGPQFHAFVHLVHYIAPLMADFNPSASNTSFIYLGKGKDLFIIQWTDMILNGTKETNETFTFQTILHKNGTVVLAYEKIPIEPTTISNTSHHVTVGLADGFIMTYVYTDKNTGKKTTHKHIYTYHKLNFQLKKVKSHSAYKLDLLPNCVQFTDCTSCLNSTKYTPFNCRWCPALQRCSDSFDWHRHVWLQNKCDKNSLSDMKQCTTPLTKPKKDGKKNSKAIIGGVIGVMLFLLLVAGLCLLYYSYTHPQSKSGMWLIENHPRRIMKRKFDRVRDEELL